LDIPREPPKKRKKYIYGGIGVVAIVVITVALGRLEPAAPSVDRGLVFTDTVRRGTLLREVRAPGTLEPEQIRWVPAVTAGRVERRLVQPGTRVEATTVLLELSNPEVQLELLEAERQLSAARAQLVSLRTLLETQRLNQAGVVASVHAQQLEAQRQAEASQELAARGLEAEGVAARVREAAEEYGARLAIERERLRIYTESIGPQLEVQEEQVTRLTSIVEFQRRRIASMRVTAGTDGVLQDMRVEDGEWVLAGHVLARVVKPEQLKAVLRVPQVQARDVVLGQRVAVDTRRDTIPGHVMRIDPAVQNSAVEVDVALDGELPPGARPDLAVDGTIEIERLDDVMYVGRPRYAQPSSTIGLFKMVGGGYAERVSVDIGRTSVSAVEIVDGLAVGDVVILSDMAQWDRYQRVRIR
jgi:multidrug efflux pump subunit AcrA (membrane-fusion protein)